MNERNHQIQVSRVSDIPLADKLAWGHLWHANTVDPNPFLSPDWASAVSEQLVTTEVAIVRDGGRVIAVLPFDRGHNGRAGPVGRVLSDGDGLLYEQGQEVDARSIVRACGLRSFTFVHKPSRLDPLDRFEEQVRFSAHLNLNDGFDNYREAREASGTEAFRVSERKMRKLAREKGRVHFEFRVNRGDVVSKLLAWKAAQVRLQGHVTSDADARWIVPLLEGLNDRFGCGMESIVSGLYVGERLIAAHWGLRSKALFVSAIPTFDAEFSRYSPGLLMTIELLKHSAREGVTDVELGLGLNQMKKSLMTHTRSLGSGTVDATKADYLARQARRQIPRIIARTAKRVRRA